MAQNLPQAQPDLELVAAAEAACRWLGKAIADNAFADCVNPGVANVDLGKLESAVRAARAAHSEKAA